MVDHSLHILVTGASRGLGASLAKHCAQHYAKNHPRVLLSLVARNETALTDCARQCQHYGAEVNYYIADLQNTDTTMTMIETIAKQPVDIAFINAAARSQHRWRRALGPTTDDHSNQSYGCYGLRHRSYSLNETTPARQTGLYQFNCSLSRLWS